MTELAAASTARTAEATAGTGGDPAERSAARRGRLARAGLTLALVGLVNRAAGWLRLIVIAAIFGASVELDAYFAAFRIPDAIFQLVAGGVLGSVLIPGIARLRPQGEDGAWRMVSGVANILLAALVLLALLGAVAAPQIVPLIAPGFGPEQLALVVDLTRLMLVSPICFGLGAVAASVLNSEGRFGSAAAAPLAYNLSIIGAALLLAPALGVRALALGVAAGALAFLALQLLPLLRRTSFRYHADAGLAEPGVRPALALLAPRTLGLAGTQLVFIANTALASTVGVGAVTAYTIAFTLLLIPVGLVAVPLGVVVFPSLARAAAAGSTDELRRLLEAALRFTLWSAALLTALSMVLVMPAVRILFGHGALGGPVLETIAATGFVLFAGIGAHSVNLVAARAFYALQDTRTPVLLTLAQVAVTIAVALALAVPLGLPGLAMAVVLGSWLKAAAMVTILGRRGLLDAPALLHAVGRFAVAGAAAAVAAWAASAVVAVAAPALWPLLGSALALVGGAAAGSAAYVATTVALRLPDARRAAEMLRLALGRR